MADSRGNQNQRVHEIVNKYYYDIESITVYFKRYCIFSKRFEHKRIAWVMLFLMLSISYHAIMVVAMESSILQKYIPIHIYENNYLGWILYISSLIAYVLVIIFIDSKKREILELRYGSKNIQEVQDKWIEKNLPKDVNILKLVNKNTEWFQSYNKFNYNDVLSTGKLIQNSKVDIVMKNIFAFLGVAFSAKFLGGIEVSEVAAKYPNEAVQIVFSLFLLILLLLFLYSMFQVFAKRLIAAVDGRSSKASYRFNVFNKMLLHHVTLKDFKD